MSETEFQTNDFPFNNPSVSINRNYVTVQGNFSNFKWRENNTRDNIGGTWPQDSFIINHIRA